MKRTSVLCALALLLTACASHAPPPAAPEPEVEEAVAEIEVIEAETPLEQRIEAPFAVQSSGRPAPRERRRAAVVLDTTPAPPAAPLAAAEAPADTAATGNGASAAEPAPPAAPPPAAPAAPAAPRAATAAPARPQPREHRVAAGETLMAIARRYGVSYTALLNSNPGIDPDRLRPNQVVRVPAAATPAAGSGAPAASRPAATATPAPARPQPAATRRTHTVAQGETLWSIARRYGVTVEQIRAANRLQDDTVRIGQTLAIPNG